MSSRSRLPLSVPGERRLAPITLAFFVFGGFWGSWAVSTAEVQRSLGLSSAGFGILLSVGLLGAAAGNAAGGSAAERWGTGPVLTAAYGAWGFALVVGATLHDPGLFGLSVVVALAAGGVVDVSMNVAATASLAHQPGYLVRFHARFNAGAAIGAAVTGGLLATGQSWRLVWLALASAGAFVGWLCRRSDLPAGEPGGVVRLRDVRHVIASEALTLVALAFAVGAMVEGGVELWGVLYLRTRLHSGLLIGAGGAVAAYLVATAARAVLGPRAGSRGPARGVLLGAVAAAAGCSLLALSPAPALAAAGLVLAAAGISMTWPLLLSEAGGGRARPGAVVGAVSTVGYLGLVAGPTLVGLVAGRAGLRSGLLLLATAAVFVAFAPSARHRGGAVPRPS